MLAKNKDQENFFVALVENKLHYAAIAALFSTVLGLFSFAITYYSLLLGGVTSGVIALCIAVASSTVLLLFRERTVRALDRISSHDRFQCQKYQVRVTFDEAYHEFDSYIRRAERRFRELTRSALPSAYDAAAGTTDFAYAHAIIITLKKHRGYVERTYSSNGTALALRRLDEPIKLEGLVTPRHQGLRDYREFVRVLDDLLSRIEYSSSDGHRPAMHQ